MYLSTHKKKVKSKTYISYSLRTSYRDAKGKVKHKHIANLPKCTDEEIKVFVLLKALLHIYGPRLYQIFPRVQEDYSVLLVLNVCNGTKTVYTKELQTKSR